jgi:hypothetical protein
LKKQKQFQTQNLSHVMLILANAVEDKRGINIFVSGET